MQIKKLMKGFTLIELLIVIALLGALAVGLLAAVDPFEQLKKGKDTSIRNTAAEFYNASIRYYAQRNQFPWVVANPSFATASITDLGALSSSITEAASAGELKGDFYALAGGTMNLKQVSVYYPNSEKVVVCFNPQSKAFRNDSNTRFDLSGVEKTTDLCPKATATDCYVCFQ